MTINKDNVLSTLSDDQKTALVELAIDKANEEGYCAESYSVLELMGLDVEERETEVAITFSVALRPGQIVSVLNSDFVLRDNDYNELDIFDYGESRIVEA